MSKLSRRTFIALGGTALIGVGAVAGFSRFTARAEAATTLSPDEALAAAERGDVLLVDIRRPDEWAETGVPAHAVAIDMRDDEFISKLTAARISDTQPVAVICARGIRSARLTQRLIEAGITPIIDVPEGILGSLAGPGWLRRGLPVREAG